MVAAAGRRVTTGTVRRSRRGCEDGKRVPARTETAKTKAAATARAARAKSGGSSTAGTARAKAAAGDGHGTKLVIVESPSKARTIAGYLGQGYVVESSVGHIRDMPDSAAEIPAKYKGEPWARLGVNVDDNFEPLLRRAQRQAAAGLQAQEPAQGRRRTPARDGRGPRGRGHRLAPARGAQAQGADQPDGLPRDHPGGDRPRHRQPAGARPGQGRRLPGAPRA